MVKFIFLLMCFIFGTMIYGDDFDDYIQSCEYLSKNFNRAAASPESRAGQEYRMHLETAKKQAGNIQIVIRRLNMGDDFDFPALTKEMQEIYTMSSRSKTSQNAQKGLHSLSKTPDGIFAILLFDVKNLRDLEFTMEDGGSIKSEVATKRRIYEFERYFQFFLTGRKKYLSGKDKKDISFCRFFDLRCQRFPGLADELSTLIRKKNPKGVSANNLSSETANLLSAFQKIVNQKAKGKKHKAERRSTSRTKRSDKKGKKTATPQDSIENLYSEMQISIRNISEIIRQLKYSNFVTDPPLKGGTKKSELSEDPADVLKGPGPKVNYEEMNEAALLKELWKRRKAIIKNNTSIDGFDSQSEKKYLRTLTADQKKLFNEYLKTDINKGYEREIAVRNSLLRIHSEMQISNKNPSKKEMVRILENMDKDRKKENERTKVRF